MANRPSRLGQRVAGFWNWWKREIAQVAQERFAALRGRPGVPLVAFEGGDVRLLEPASIAGAEARVSLESLDEPHRRAAFRSLLERAGETRGRTRLKLERGEALLRRVTMPLATEENMRQVLAFEMDRLTPFEAAEVYYDYRVVSRDAASGLLAVQLAIARRDVVEARLAKLRGLGGNAQAVVVGDPSAGAELLDLLPSEQRGEGEDGRGIFWQRGLAALALAFLVAAIALPLWRKRETVIVLQPLVATASQQAQAADRLARQLEGQVADYNFLLEKKYASYPVLDYVEEISRLLPDNTWLQQLEIRSRGKTREIQLTGETGSASKLIELLERSNYLRNATPKGTVTRGSTPNTERFMLAAESQSRTPPQPVALLSMPAGNASPMPSAPPSTPKATKPPAENSAQSPAPPSAARSVATPPRVPAPPAAPPASKAHEASGFGPPSKSPR